jgi:cell division protein FtsX
MQHKGKRGSGRTARDPIAIMDALLHDVAAQAAEDHVPKLQREFDQNPAGDRARPASKKRGVTIPPELLELDRETLLAQIEHLEKVANVNYQQSELTGLSDHDLRVMLAMLLDPERH